MRHVSVYRYMHLPDVDWDQCLEHYASQDLSLLTLEHLGWEPVSDGQWHIDCNELMLIHCVRRFKRVPKSMLDETVARELDLLGETANAFEKRQVKQKVLEQLLADVLPEKITIPVILDTRHQQLWIGSSSESVLEKILKLVHMTCPGLMLTPLCSRERVLRSLRLAWQKNSWPSGVSPQGDALLVHGQDKSQKIRCTGLDDLGIISDCMAQGYALSALRLTREDGWSCFWSTSGAFQSLRYPKVDQEEIDPAMVDWLPYLELRAWCGQFGVWLDELA